MIDESEEKEQFKVYINRDVLRNFKAYVYEKHGTKARGLLSFEAEQALMQYLGMNHRHAPRTKVFRQNNPAPKIYILKEEIKKWIGREYGIDFDSVYQVPDKFIRSAIQEIKGYDRRTVVKWLNLLQEHNCIRRISLGQWEVL